MSRSRWALVRRVSPLALLTIGVVAVGLLLAARLVAVRVVVVHPPLGDVSGTVGTVWDVSLGVATFGSFALAVSNYRRPRDNDTEDQTIVSGDNNDVDEQNQMVVSGDNNDVTVNIDAESVGTLLDKSGTSGDDTPDEMDEGTATDARSEVDDSSTEKP